MGLREEDKIAAIIYAVVSNLVVRVVPAVSLEKNRSLPESIFF